MGKTKTIFQQAAAVAKKTVQGTGDIIRQPKESFNYLKAGIKADSGKDTTVQAVAAKNKLRMKNIREGNPEKNLKLDNY